MKKYVFLIILAALSLCIISCTRAGRTEYGKTNQLPENNKVNSDYQQAFEKMCECLEQRYRYPYIEPGLSEKEYLREKQRLEEKLSDITTLPQLYCCFQGFVARFNDLHTSIMVDYENDEVKNEFKFLPCTFKPFQGKWYLMGCDNVNEKYLGWELVSINTIKMSGLRKKVAGFVSCENTNWSDFQTAVNLISTDVLKYLQVVEDESAPVQIVLKCEESKEENTIEVIPVSYAKRETVISSRVQRDIKPVTEPLGKYQAFLLNDTVYYIQINQCSPDPNKPIDDFKNLVMDEIEKKKPDKIIIDLRDNTGGDKDFTDDLVEWLAEQALQGQSIYTLIGNKTASAAVMTAINLKNKTGCTLIGEPTGGKPNFNGGIASKQLDPLPIRLNYTTEYITMVKDDELMSLEPDVYVAQTLEDWKKGKDTAVNLILEKDSY